MKIPVPLDFSPAQARVAIDLLEILIDVLIDFHGALTRAYHPSSLPNDTP